MLRSSLSSCLKTAVAMDAAAAAVAQKRSGAAVTALATRASSYASSSNSPSDADSTVSSPTFFSSSSLANSSVQSAAPYSSSAAATTIRTTTCQVPAGMGCAASAQCYRSVEEPTLHEDYDELEMHHLVREEAHSSYYNYSYDPEEDCEEMGSIV
mmetsp:Transcript_24818/g.35520  ORF Transcript_24818/g.35520 Transcript_24818/m.35520 type:complete len:155 (-) Transcript_24818:150-614(-)|eukprot:CAMPEP_0201697230 /NCGR_PEP_ID=MMETSP0578-20130828/10112_1 /ASSEMBLY_ACC=CAM_ASM_000663 /TAXON_ID=267565 /ORGANISM="Skeletonema grethea, Strain CCMP 1804" /LENGTH=154 /DNA_ID=CAMNT_0048183339 /DNA_START=193 /DNA_END=657 /DNA_ORIENTATION=+